MAPPVYNSSYGGESQCSSNEYKRNARPMGGDVTKDPNGLGQPLIRVPVEINPKGHITDKSSSSSSSSKKSTKHESDGKRRK